MGRSGSDTTGNRPSTVGRGLSIAGLCLFVPLTAFLLISGLVALGGECSPRDTLCLTGPGAALLFGGPGLLTTAICCLLGAGLVREDDRRRRHVLTGTAVAAVVLAVAAVLTVLFV